MAGLHDLDEILASLDATLHGTYVFASVQAVPDSITPFAVIREDEGLTIIATEDEARHAGLPMDERYSRITLSVHSALGSVGLTATISQTLASRSIPCNVVAGYYHDHLFVDADRAPEAIMVLDQLARQARGWMPGQQA